MIFSLLFSLAACRGNSEQKVVDPVVEFDSAFCERLMPGLGVGESPEGTEVYQST